MVYHVASVLALVEWVGRPNNEKLEQAGNVKSEYPWL
jgi:hypothetical protein